MVKIYFLSVLKWFPLFFFFFVSKFASKCVSKCVSECVSKCVSECVSKCVSKCVHNEKHFSKNSQNYMNYISMEKNSTANMYNCKYSFLNANTTPICSYGKKDNTSNKYDYGSWNKRKRNKWGRDYLEARKIDQEKIKRKKNYHYAMKHMYDKNGRRIKDINKEKKSLRKKKLFDYEGFKVDQIFTCLPEEDMQELREEELKRKSGEILHNNKYIDTYGVESDTDLDSL
ncbi:conserved Plasmodium protein, unknown function [Plasmodium malariae]|uniref:Uncharacterized protein n=1 Tax=Plasmodium malariae TaxID=5858 RepID=A0A1C3L0Q2_PLAMA|nr:conserved Plasmodium protein, unknown function [Plasmodium malariae]